MCSSPPLALLTLPSIRSPSPFLLDLPLLSLLSLSLFFEFVKSFGVAITENLFLFFGKFGLNGNGISPRLLGDMDSAKERFNIRTIRESICFGYNLGIDRVFEFGFSEGIF